MTELTRRLFQENHYQRWDILDGDVCIGSLTKINGTNLPTLRNSLVAQYGQPTRSGSTQIWNDPKTGNTVSYYDVGGVVGRIEYKKLGGSGL